MTAKQSKGKGILRAGYSRADQNVLNEQSLHRVISLERKRSERSGKPFLLMLLDMKGGLPSEKKGNVLRKVFASLAQNLRETDVMGWYKDNGVVGVVFTELNLDDRGAILSTVMNKSQETLRRSLAPEHFELLNISFHSFPNTAFQNVPKRPSTSERYPDAPRLDSRSKLFRVTKMLMSAYGRLAES